MILVTAYGSEEVAMQALRAGAANYIAKRNLTHDLIPTIRQVLEMAASKRERARILQRLVRMESVFVLDNDPDLIVAFMKLVREELAGMRFWDETGLVQVQNCASGGGHQCRVSRQSRSLERASADG